MTISNFSMKAMLTGNFPLKDKNGWYIRGDNGAKTIPHHLTELFLEAQKLK